MNESVKTQLKAIVGPDRATASTNRIHDREANHVCRSCERGPLQLSQVCNVSACLPLRTGLRGWSGTHPAAESKW